MIHFILCHNTPILSKSPVGFTFRIYSYFDPLSAIHCYHVEPNIIYSLDYCNNFLSGLSVSIFSPSGIYSQHSNQNNLFKTFIILCSPLLRILQCFLISLRMNVKVLKVVYKALHYLLSKYFSGCTSFYLFSESLFLESSSIHLHDSFIYFETLLTLVMRTTLTNL